MNRRGFIAGLLATTVAVPFVKPIVPMSPLRQFGLEAIAAFEERQAYLLTNPPLFVSPNMMDAAIRAGVSAYGTHPLRLNPMLPLDDGEAVFDEFDQIEALIITEDALENDRYLNAHNRSDEEDG